MPTRGSVVLAAAPQKNGSVWGAGGRWAGGGWAAAVNISAFISFLLFRPSGITSHVRQPRPAFKPELHSIKVGTLAGPRRASQARVAQGSALELAKQLRIQFVPTEASDLPVFLFFFRSHGENELTGSGRKSD